jgi:hypothetical protein
MNDEELVSGLIQYLEMQYEYLSMPSDEIAYKQWITWLIKKLEEIK